MESDRNKPDSAVARAALRALFVVFVACLAAVCADGWAARAVYFAADGAARTGAMCAVGAARVLVCALGVAAAVFAAVRLFRRGLVETGGEAWPAVRFFFYAWLVPLAAVSFARAAGFLQDSLFLARSIFFSAGVAALSVWAVAASSSRWRSRLGRGAWRVVDIALANVVIFLVLFEAAAVFLLRRLSSPLFYDQSSAECRVEAMRWKPGMPYFNFHLNSRGYHDEEFFRAGKRDFVAVALSDSFGIGVVPYEYNFITVAERALRRRIGADFERVAVHNFGIAGIGMPEYAHVYITEAVHFNPAAVILCVFVGNDIFEFAPVRATPEYSYLQGWTFARALSKILAVAREMGRHRTFDAGAVGAPREPAGEVPEYVFDWTKEPERFSKEAFMEIERCRIEVCNPLNSLTLQLFREFFAWLEYFKALAGDKLLVVLLPDEFQVNDALWNELMAAAANRADYRRDYPQERIMEFCARRGIRVLDLLADLRLAEAEGRTYHLQDTHFNARGNRVAGERIAECVVKEFVSR